MKIRTDFVSNSSSSSFMLVGASFNDEEVKNAWIKLHPEDAEDYDEDCYTNDIADELADELGLIYDRGIDNYYDEYCIGLTYDKMDANETKAQFEKRIADKLNTVFEVDKVYCMIDGGYEG